MNASMISTRTLALPGSPTRISDGSEGTHDFEVERCRFETYAFACEAEEHVLDLVDPANTGVSHVPWTQLTDQDGLRRAMCHDTRPTWPSRQIPVHHWVPPWCR